MEIENQGDAEQEAEIHAVESEFEAGDAAQEPQDEKADELRILEALLFVSEELLTPAKLKSLIPGEPDARRIRKMVNELNTQLRNERHPFEIVETGGGYQFRTIAFYYPWIRKLYKDRAAKKLSLQALECLAIIAYRQPISKAEVEAVRGVLSDGAMKTLLEKKLVNISGRSDKPGRPLLYSTTTDFLKYFGINKLSDLPRIEEFEAMARQKMEVLSTEELSSQETSDNPEEEPEQPESQQVLEQEFEQEQTQEFQPERNICEADTQEPQGDDNER